MRGSVALLLSPSLTASSTRPLTAIPTGCPGGSRPRPRSSFVRHPRRPTILFENGGVMVLLLEGMPTVRLSANMCSLRAENETTAKHTRLWLDGDPDMIRHVAILGEWYLCVAFALPPSKACRRRWSRHASTGRGSSGVCVLFRTLRRAPRRPTGRLLPLAVPQQPAAKPSTPASLPVRLRARSHPRRRGRQRIPCRTSPIGLVRRTASRLRASAKELEPLRQRFLPYMSPIAPRIAGHVHVLFFDKPLKCV